MTTDWMKHDGPVEVCVCACGHVCTLHVLSIQYNTVEQETSREKLSQILLFCAYQRELSLRSVDSTCKWYKQAIHESFLRENPIFPPICESFLPQKIPVIR